MYSYLVINVYIQSNLPNRPPLQIDHSPKSIALFGSTVVWPPKPTTSINGPVEVGPTVGRFRKAWLYMWCITNYASIKIQKGITYYYYGNIVIFPWGYVVQPGPLCLPRWWHSVSRTGGYINWSPIVFTHHLSVITPFDIALLKCSHTLVIYVLRNFEHLSDIQY